MGVSPPISASAVESSVTGLALPSVSITPTTLKAAQRTRPDLGLTLVERGHQLAAKRLCEDEYENYLGDSIILQDKTSGNEPIVHEMHELIQGQL